MSLPDTIFIDTGVPTQRSSWLASTIGVLLAIGAGAAAAAIIAVTFRGAWPPPGSPVGLALGTVGFVLMAGAQSLYTMRKRLPGFSRGRMSTWLQAHVFMGLFGAILVAFHAGGRLAGVAGAAFVAMTIVIASGLVGRYLYTAAPRTLDGIEIDSRDLLARFAAAGQRLREAGLHLDAADIATLGAHPDLPGWLAVLARPILSWRHALRSTRFVRGLVHLTPDSARELRQVLRDRYELQLDIRSVAAARHWLSWWHVCHVPMSWVMFTLAVVHIAGSLSYLSR